VLLASDLPDISRVKHMVSDRSDDLNDILNAFDHLVEIHAANLPETRAVKDVNWRAKLILAEIRDWANCMSREDAMVNFREMLASLQTRSQLNELAEVEFMK